MTGQINVNKIAARTGNTITVNSGDKISGAAGSLNISGTCVQIAVKNIATKQIINNTANVTGVDTVIVS